MQTIKILDGNDSIKYGNDSIKYGKALAKAFTEHAKYQKILLSSEPGSLDYSIYTLIKNAENKAYNKSRKQTNADKLFNNLLNNNKINILGKKSFTLINSDLYRDNLNWCFGLNLLDKSNGSHIILSTYRIKNFDLSKCNLSKYNLNKLDLFTNLAIHELGHMFGSASIGRKNTEYTNLGSHCINNCVMKQYLNISDLVKNTIHLYKQNNKFCKDCISELKGCSN